MSKATCAPTLRPLPFLRAYLQELRPTPDAHRKAFKDACSGLGPLVQDAYVYRDTPGPGTLVGHLLLGETPDELVVREQAGGYRLTVPIGRVLGAPLTAPLLPVPRLSHWQLDVQDDPQPFTPWPGLLVATTHVPTLTPAVAGPALFEALALKSELTGLVPALQNPNLVRHRQRARQAERQAVDWLPGDPHSTVRALQDFLPNLQRAAWRLRGDQLIGRLTFRGPEPLHLTLLLGERHLTVTLRAQALTKPATDLEGALLKQVPEAVEFTVKAPTRLGAGATVVLRRSIPKGDPRPFADVVWSVLKAYWRVRGALGRQGVHLLQ